MDELAGQLQAILNDPAQMAQLSSLAASLGVELPQSQPGAAANPPSGAASAQPTPPPQAAPNDGFDLNALQKLLPLLQQSSGKEAQVFAALRPFLSGEDQKRADRALRAAKLSRLAKLALQGLREDGFSGVI